MPSIELIAEIELLKKQIEAMKCCGNCANMEAKLLADECRMMNGENRRTHGSDVCHLWTLRTK